MRMVVGLGNPGRRYARTRHNVGFRVLDRLCVHYGVEAGKRAFEARCVLTGEAENRVLLVKPQTFMNESGRAIRSLAGYYKVGPEGILLVCDDLALPTGRLRLRRGGSSGGQKGVASTIAALGTDRFPRLRIGIGAAPAHMDAADYVLSRFSEAEEAAIETAVDQAADCVQVWLREGVDGAMNQFNRSPPPGDASE
ncbi:aminoacyl-tRNA hydrolase [Planctomycetota bacterium]